MDERPQTQISRCCDHGGATAAMVSQNGCCTVVLREACKKGGVEKRAWGGISLAQTELDRFPHAGQRSSVGRLKNSLLQCRKLMHKDRLQFLFIKDTRFFLSFLFFAHHLEACS